MVEPVTTAAVAGAGAASTAASTASTTAGAVTTAASGIAQSTGNWFMDTLTAPFRWVGSILSAPFEAIASIPRNIIGAGTGAVKNVFSFSNVPFFAAVTLALSFMKAVYPAGWRDTRVATLGEDKATATRAIEEISKDGLTGIGFDSAKQAALMVGGISAITGAVEGGGVLAGVGLIGGLGFLTYKTLFAAETPTATPAATPLVAKPEKAKA